MNRFAKVVNGKVIAIVGSELGFDDRRDGDGEFIWRRIVTHVPDYEITTQMLGDTILQVSDEIVIETYEIIPLIDMPTIHERLEALETGDIAKIKKHCRIIDSLKESGRQP